MQPGGGPESLLRRTLLLTMASGAAPGAAAMWAQMSDEELIRSSVLIVNGEWVGQTPATQRGQAIAGDIGVVAVSEVLKGPPGSALALVAVAGAGTPRSSSDIAFRRGDRGLWLLRAHGSGPIDLLAADHPQRFVPAGSGAPRIAALRRLLGR